MSKDVITRFALMIGIFALLAVFTNAEIFIEDLDNGKYNLGETVLVEGYVQESSKFSGTLEINFFCGNETRTILFSLINLDADEKHGFSQDFLVTENLEGSCYFLVNVDGSGVSEEKKSEDFVVSNELRVDSDIDVLTQKPGNDVVVSGVIRKSNGLRVESGSVALSLDGKVFGVGLSGGAFSYRITLAKDIDSGEHTILVKARDLNGNEGEGNVKFRVISVPEKLIININNDFYRPSENLVATVLLNDQSGDNVFGSSTIRLVDSNGKDALTKVVDNGNEFQLFLDELTLPGTWTLNAESKGFQTSKKFYVEEVKDKEVKLLEGNKLAIRNIGNVNYDESIEVKLDRENGEEFRIIKETSLKPNQTIIVDLNNEVPGGNYDVSVGGNLITGNVVLEGSAIENLKQNSIVGYFSLAFVFLFLIFVVISKNRRKLNQRESARGRGREILLKRGKSRDDYGDSHTVRTELDRRREIARSRGEDIKDRERREIQGGLMKASREDVDYMLNKVKREVPVDSEKKNLDKGNLFNIFDR